MSAALDTNTSSSSPAGPQDRPEHYKLVSLQGDRKQVQTHLNRLAEEGYRVQWIVSNSQTALLEYRPGKARPPLPAAAPAAEPAGAPAAEPAGAPDGGTAS